MAITTYHQAIFDFLETYRSEHPEANLTYYLRQNHNPKRLRNQYLFLGSETYISIGLYSPSNGKTKTKSIQFISTYDPAADTIKSCSLEIVYDDPKLDAQQFIYQQIIQQIGSDLFEEFSSKRYELIYGDPDWQTNLLTYLKHHKPIIDEVLRQAGAVDTFHIPLEKLEEDIRTLDQIVSNPTLSMKYTWIPFYRELCSRLFQCNIDQLISYTKEILKVQKLVGLKDQDADGNPIILADIDPYTVLSFISIGSEEKRLRVLARLQKLLSITVSVPTDLSGLYTSKNQWVWLFGYSFERQPDDIEKLRELYGQVEEDAISEALFNDVLTIKKLKSSKLSESLFTQWPEKYFPVNTHTKAWLKKRNLPFQFGNLAEYRRLIQTVQEHDSRSFVEISEEAFSENNAPDQPKDYIDTTYWVFQGNPSQFRIVDSLKDEILQTWRVTAHIQKIKAGDKVILWVTGNESGCYALAEVASDVYTGSDEPDEQPFQLNEQGDVSSQRVKIKILLNLWDQPVLKADLQSLPAFRSFNGGEQGTNFTATQEQYETIYQLARPSVSASNRRFWKYSPGSQASRWPTDQQEGIMAISFSIYNTGSLDQYKTQADLDKHVGKIGNSSNQTWNMILFKDAALGDVVLANQGLNTVVGIGLIKGPYQYRPDSPQSQHYREVDWLANQPWQYTKNQFSGNQNLFRPDTFSPTRIGPQLLQEYVKKYPAYRPVFEKHGLLEPIELESQIMDVFADRYAKNIILYGPPGTGKTYATIDLSVDIVKGQKSVDHRENKILFDQLREEGQIEFVTFHQNYTYEDFVMGLKPDVDSGTLKFEQREGIFYRLAKRARQNYEASHKNKPTNQLRPFDEVFEEFMRPLTEEDKPIEVSMASGILFQITGVGERSLLFEKSNGSRKHTLSISTLKRIYEGGQDIQPNGLKPYYFPLSTELAKAGRQISQQVLPKNYVLIIDEINRANMSRVFGELITLLEDDKRLGGDNQLTVTLPSGELFAVPPNLYLIGTMNTADKSLALLDIALRRRFEFIGKYPDYTVLVDKALPLLQKLNKVILQHKKSADFLIGHAYFMNKSDQQLKSVLDNRVIPLLMEYFNGRTDMVEKILNEAEILYTQNELTFQLEAEHVV